MQYVLMPEVPGELGDNTIIDANVHPPIVSYLHFIFYGWLGDDLLECFPVFLVSDKLRNLLAKSKLTGIEISECEVDASEEFTILQPKTILPKFYWLKIYGNHNDDFFINASKKLQVSSEAWIVLNEVNISYCDVDVIE